MVISTNTQALIANAGLWKTNNALFKSSEKLSTGVVINKTGDDPTGMAISNRMKTQIRSLDQADNNVLDSINLISTAESAVANINDIVTRMAELAVQAANDTLGTSDRELVQQEISEYLSEIESITDKVQFNGKSLLNDDYELLTFQVGVYEGDEIQLNLENIDSAFLGLALTETLETQAGVVLAIADTNSATGWVDREGNDYTPDGTEVQLAAVDVTTQAGADELIDRCEEALSRIAVYRTELGCIQNRLEFTSSSLIMASENTSISLSNILDTDMAEEMAEYTKSNVLVQAGISMLSQANQRPNQILSLLQ